jgi:hypothetical protein
MSAMSLSERRDSDPSLQDQPKMCDRERLIIGAIGGLLAGIAVYPIPGYQSILYADGGAWLLAGLAIRLTGFAALGGLWAYMNGNEHDRKNVFQMGLVGPAIISAFLTANTPKVEVRPADEPLAMSISIVSPSHAQGSQSTSAPSTSSTTSSIRRENLSLSQKIWWGFTGQTITKTSQQLRKDIEQSTTR